MPIRINLMAEAQALEEARRRNPVKLGAWIAGFCVAVVGIWILKVQLDVHFAKDSLAKFNDGWKRDETNFNNVTAQKGRVEAAKQKIAALDHLSTNRFLWGPVLNALQYTVVDEVQVTHFTALQTFEREPPKNLAGKTIPGSANFEKIKLSIAGKDYSAAGEGYKKYEDALNHYPFFVAKMGGHEGFTIDGAPGPKVPNGPGSTVESRSFTLTNQFPVIRRDDR
jgi:hypothetical protein